MRNLTSFTVIVFWCFLASRSFFSCWYKIFPVIHDAAYGRLRGGRNLDQIQVLAAGHFERFEGGHYANLLAFIVRSREFRGLECGHWFG